MRYLLLLIFSTLFASCWISEKRELSKPYVVFSITEVDEFGFGNIDFIDYKGVEAFAYDDVKFYYKGQIIK